MLLTTFPDLGKEVQKTSGAGWVIKVRNAFAAIGEFSMYEATAVSDQKSLVPATVVRVWLTYLDFTADAPAQVNQSVSVTYRSYRILNQDAYVYYGILAAETRDFIQKCASVIEHWIQLTGENFQRLAGLSSQQLTGMSGFVTGLQFDQVIRQAETKRKQLFENTGAHTGYIGRYAKYFIWKYANLLQN